MKFLLVFGILLSSLWGITLDWLHDYPTALKEAKIQNKDVYLFVGADHCRFCTRFKKITLSNKAVMKRLRKEYILVYLSRDRHKIPSKFKIHQVPRHYFLDSDGKVIFETRGSREVAGFNSLLDEVDVAKD